MLQVVSLCLCVSGVCALMEAIDGGRGVSLNVFVR